MHGMFIKKDYKGNICLEFNFDGNIAMKYKDITLHVGDVVEITDDFNTKTLPTFVREYKDGYSIFGFENYCNQKRIDKNKITNIKILKKYKDIETGYRIRGLIAKIDQYDIDKLIQLDKENKKPLNMNLSIDDRMNILTLMINNLLSKTPSKEDAEQITKWNNEYLVLKAFKQDKHDIKYSTKIKDL